MKHIFLLFALVLGVKSQAQLTYENFEGGESEYLFTRRSTVIKLGVGMGANKNEFQFREYKTSSYSPSINLSFEKAFLDFGKGFVMGYGIGGSVAKITLEPDLSVRIPGYESTYRNDIVKNTLITGHLGLNLHKSFNEKLEVYVAGNFIASFNTGEIDDENAMENAWKFRPAFGVRYKFYKELGIFAEAGTHRDYFRIGISLF